MIDDSTRKLIDDYCAEMLEAEPDIPEAEVLGFKMGAEWAFSLVELILLFEIVLLLLSVETKPPWSLKLTLLFVIVLKLAPDNPIPKAFRFASLWSMVL